jgi:polyhydroxyalkanoate synthase subunit PhaC
MSEPHQAARAAVTSRGTTPRAGPRPLPLHLMTHASTLAGSQAALPLWKDGSLLWKPHLAAAAADLRQSLAAAGADAAEAFAGAVAAEAARRHEIFLTGIDAYRRHPYRRGLPPAPTVWSDGTTRLLDYRLPGAEGGVPVLLVPSLINRAYILDLMPKRSLVRYLAAKGLAPFLVDWGAPGEAEAAFTLTDYVAGRLEAALDAVTGLTGRAVTVLGYCMGGLLALALAQRRPRQAAALALMATPWDFAAGRESHAVMMRALAQPMGRLIDAAGSVPVDILQAMFASLDPGLAARKFIAFARLKRRSARARDFVALEDWANDGVALAGPVARECLFGWYGDNQPAAGNWRIGDRPVLPEEVTVPTLLLVPERDRIVPPGSALPLAKRIANAKLMMLTGGHVGMLTGARAKTDVYGPLAKWLVRSAVQ